MNYLIPGLLILFLAVGAYNCLRFVVAKHLENKRARAHRREIDAKIEATVDYASHAYSAVKDPATQEYIVRDIAGKVHKALKAGDIKLADQFASTTERVAKSDTPATSTT